MTDRTAIDTIKGYFYQFDYAISKLLELSAITDTIVVEGIEDVDINTATESSAVQCKYYAKTEYNHSVIAKPIRLMLDHYKEVLGGTRSRIKYKLYGYFQAGQSKLIIPFDSTFLKDKFLTYTEAKIIYSHHTELGLTDVELDDFISLLTIDITAIEYELQLSNIWTFLKHEFKCSDFEAEHFYYNNALKVIKDIAVEGDVVKRRISKGQFLSKINFKGILFNEWFVKYKGEIKHFADLRSQYFTTFNISPFARFFLIEIPNTNYIRADLKDLIFTISNKWSKLSSRETSPFCPYIYLHGISKTELIELKKELLSEGFDFTDGFDFEGASFNPKSLSKIINNSLPIKIRFINAEIYIDIILKEIVSTKEMYQFYMKQIFLDIDYVNVKHIKIQVAQLSNIKKII